MLAMHMGMHYGLWQILFHWPVIQYWFARHEAVYRSEIKAII